MSLVNFSPFYQKLITSFCFEFTLVKYEDVW